MISRSARIGLMRFSLVFEPWQEGRRNASGGAAPLEPICYHPAARESNGDARPGSLKLPRASVTASRLPEVPMTVRLRCAATLAGLLAATAAPGLAQEI